jgi:hypothetical protein
MGDIASILAAVAFLINAVVTALSYLESRRNGRKIALNSSTIDALEKNTNSIKDALIKVTAESEHAKGLLQGRAENIVENAKP